MHFTKGMGRVPSSARAHVHTALLYLRNGLTDCVRIWWVGCGPWTMCFPQVMGGISLHVRTCTPRFCISGMAWPIVFKFGVWVGGYQQGAFHKSWAGCICTCARAHPFSMPRELLGAEIWWVIRVPVAMCFMQVFGWALLHVRTCTPYLRISRTDWPIVLKFDVWLDTQMLRGLQKLEVGWLHIRTYVSSFVVTETAEPCLWSRTKNRFISFALARSSPNKASYWLILTVNLWSSANKFAAKLKTQHFHKTP